MLKLFNPLGPATWLICELDTGGDTLFGLCDLGAGERELGYVRLDELKEVNAGLAIGWCAFSRSEESSLPQCMRVMPEGRVALWS